MKSEDSIVEVFFERENPYERWLLFPDTRNYIKGYRVSRYTWDELSSPVWDEHYMFFTTLDQAYTACLTQNLTEGREAF